MRILVTRPEPDALRTAAALAQLGHEAVLGPVTEVRPTGAAWPTGRFDAVLATSRHAFTALGAGCDRGLPVFAVGGSTATSARAAGFRDVRVGTGDAAGLGDLLRLTLPRPGRLLYLAGRDRKAVLERELATAGHAVVAVDAYVAEAIQAWPAATQEALRDGTVDAALHYSRRSVALALALAARHGLDDALLCLRHLCLSADAAAPLRERRAVEIEIADRPDEGALLTLLKAAA